MRLKRIMAKTMACALAMSMTVTPVLADPLTEVPATDVEVSIGGETEYVETTKYKVTLPTTTSMKFTLDPVGLAGYFAANESASTVSADDLADYEGQIFSNAFAVAENESSVPIELKCKFYVKNSDGATLVDKAADVDPDGNEILLAVAAIQNTKLEGATEDTMPTMVGDAPITLGLGTADATTSSVAITGTTAATANEFTFALAPADYVFTKGADATTYEEDEDYTKVAANYAKMAVIGLVSKNGDWKTFSEKTGDNVLSLQCVYTFAGLKEIGDDAVSKANAVIDASKLTRMESAGPQAEIAISSAAGVAATATLGTEDYTLKSVVLVSYTRNGTAAAYNKTAVNGTHYTLTDDTFTLLSGMTSAWTAAEFTITYEDGDGEEFVQTITWAVETETTEG